MLDQRIKFRHLTCFLEVARQRSVVKAADTLSITQPAVSKTIRELEEHLDARLFDRSKRGVTLTDFGKVFLRYAGASVTALRQGVDSISQVRMQGGLSINLGVLPTVAASVMPNAIRRFKALSPDTTVKVVAGPNVMLMGQLRVGELDLVVGRLAEPDQMSGLSFIHLYSEHISLVARPGHPLLADKNPDITRIREFTVLVPPKQAIIHPTVDKMLIAHGIGALPDRIETVSTSFGRAFTRETDAIWIISNGAVASDIAEGHLVELPIDTSDTFGPVGLTTRIDSPVSPPVEMLINAVREEATRHHSTHSRHDT
ncbi:LysR family transcriptional regulator [Thalassospira lucentensis]|nr:MULTISPECIES: pca operon transcription factor PcaQ [Thalassospira]KZB50816.1 LysR family transcriptional regulator [Thalassospira xiamenensis]KZB61764.1 LysR family transcriptional regulator [Thalassospira lucentensis]MAZ32002.1 pca operon transcription factor PcaQ [Thalassospira sp.]MCH2276470.1 pca operon transcription factor PcaQ [Thalassospira sp.]MCK2165169.1 pca operon transcription factor PcaQ [Thalassospira xiamenensis]